MLQKSLKLLQMNSLDFARELQTFAESNPLLELEEPTVDEVYPDADYEHTPEIHDGDSPEAAERAIDDAEFSGLTAVEPWGSRKDRTGSDLAGRGLDWIATIPVQSDLSTHLKSQITDLLLSDKIEAACLAVIDSIDDRGYLEDAPAILGRHFRDLGLAASNSLVEEATQMIRSLEPAGVGAFDLKDCLTLQLERMTPSTTGLKVAVQIASEHLELLGQGNAKAIARETGESIAKVRDAIALIKTLNPSPGREFDNGRVDYIVPELAVRKIEGDWCVQPLSGVIPKIRVNKMYADILTKQGSGANHDSIKEQLHEARWLVRNMEQRDQTIFAVGQAIVARQSKYFDHGEIALKPMTLADVAADIDMHESTVSRVVSTKYLVCPSGLKPMKSFFSSHVHTNAGDSCSASAVKAMIQAIVEQEPANEPFSDHKLTELLSRQGVKIARRTVSKYRQAIGLRSFELRRHIGGSLEVAKTVHFQNRSV